MRNLARRLLLASGSGRDTPTHEATVVIEKLRTTLTRFAGVDGFVSLLRRALALASADVPALLGAKVSADGRLEGIEELATQADPHAPGSEAAVAIVAYLLSLLVTFIGAPLTLRLVREAWPNASLDEFSLRIEEN